MSQEVNPYAAPTAVVADRYADDEPSGPVKLYSAEGRIGRLRFMAWMFYSYVLAAVAISVIGRIFGTPGLGLPGSLVSLISLLLLIPYLAFYVCAGIRRSHDMGWSGWTVLLGLIPLVGFIQVFVWIVKAGTPGTNRYGAQPAPNPLSVKIGGWFFALSLLLGVMLSANAYQDYVQRAKAAKVVKP